MLLTCLIQNKRHHHSHNHQKITKNWDTKQVTVVSKKYQFVFKTQHEQLLDTILKKNKNYQIINLHKI